MAAPLTFIDLFCGAGLFSAGLERAGLRCVLGVDNDATALSSFSRNFPHSLAWAADVMDLKSLPRADVVVGSPPCQPFSVANRNPDPEAGLELVVKFVELARSSGASYWIMEEVPPVLEALVASQGGEWLEPIPRREVWECSALGARNLRPRLFLGDFPDPVPRWPACEEPAPTVTTDAAGLSIHQARELQGVPGWMVLEGSDTAQYRQVGNGVPVQVGEALGVGMVYDITGRALVALGYNHPAHHHTRAAYHRLPGRKRTYLSGPGASWCDDCKRYILDDPALEAVISRLLNQNSPSSGARDAPRSPKFSD